MSPAPRLQPMFRLLVITDRRLVPDPAAVLDRALANAPPGAVAVMLREKDLPGGPLLRHAAALRRVTRRRGALLLVNDRIDVARAADADGVHLPVSGLRPADARRLLGPEAIVGCSTHGAAEVAAARAEGADYVTFGPVFDTPSKRPYGAPVGLEALARLDAGLPVVGLGGIDAGSARSVFDAGADAVACIRAVWSAEDPAAAVDRFLAAAAARAPSRD